MDARDEGWAASSPVQPEPEHPGGFFRSNPEIAGSG